MINNTNNEEMPVWAIILVIVVFSLAAYGTMKKLFDLLRMLRIIRNTPTSKIRSASQGYVELSGRPKPIKKYLKSIFSATDCVWYSCKIEEKTPKFDNNRKQNGYEWKEIFNENSDGKVFKLQDGTGECIIIPFEGDSLNTNNGKYIDYHSLNVKYMDITKKQYLKSKIKKSGTYRYYEDLITGKDIIFSLGEFKTLPLNINPLQSLKNDVIKARNTIVKQLENKRTLSFILTPILTKIDETIKNINFSIEELNVNSEKLALENKHSFNCLVRERSINLSGFFADIRPYFISTTSQKIMMKKQKKQIVIMGVLFVLFVLIVTFMVFYLITFKIIVLYN